MDYREEMKQLRDTLNAHGYRYYVLDDPQISDYEYDHMLRRLEDLEREHPEEITPDSPTQRVGGPILTQFQEVEHPVPLESLQDVFDGGEVEEFLTHIRETFPDAEYSVEPKVDGLSVALEYRDGVFVRGATRGDGRIGEDVTENLRTIRSIPMTLPEKLPRLIVRGEVYMARSVFEELNRQREIEGKPLMANPRNAAAGSLRQLDPKIAARRRLDIAVFNLQLAEGRTFSTHTETIDYLASQQFKTISYRRLRAGEEIMEEILPYMGFYPEYTDEEAKEMNVSVPLLQDATLDTAKSTLEQLGLTYEVVGSGSSVISQSPTTGTSIVKGGKVLLYTEQNATPDLVSVPNLVGMTASQANETMAYYGLNYALVGASASSEGALVKSQSVPEGTQIQRGSSVTLTLSAGEATD